MYGLPNTAFSLVPGLLTTLTGKRALIVGGTGGIGRALAQALADNSALTTVVGRTFRDEGRANLTFLKCDLSLMAEAQRVATSLPAEELDIVAFTAGIVPGKARVETREGVELDMAASALSRWVMLKQMLPRLKPSARIFIWGFPGSKGYMAKTALDDFNSVRSFHGGFETAHMNTVALNEAMVLHLAAQGRKAYGLNPGLVPTEIRNPLHGGGLLGGFLESCIGFFNPSPAAYIAKLLPVLLSADLDAHAGAMLGQRAAPILASTELTPETVAKWLAQADALAAMALGANAGSARF